MAANPKLCRRSLLVGAVLLLVVALVIAAEVIPSVKADTSPHATPKTAVPAFWVVVVLNLMAGTALVLIAMSTAVSGRLVHVVLGTMMILIFLFALALTDAAFALYAHGPAMRLTDVLLFFCATADLGASLFVGAAALLSP
jgi:hypothetical protein